MNKKLFFALIGFVAALGGFLFGFDTAVVSGTLLFVKKQFAMSTVAEGWFVSSALVGSISGVAIAGYMSDKIGRKKVLILSSVLFFITALGCMLAKSEAQLIIYRFIGGLGIGIASIISPMYLSEISPAKIRGKMVSLYQMAITIGILSIYISNLYLLNVSGNDQINFSNEFLVKVCKTEVWRSMFGVGLIPALLFLILLFIIPESPRWLMKKGLAKRAKGILHKIRSEQEAEREAAEVGESGPKESVSIKGLMQYKKPILIGIVFAFLVQFSGITAVIYYGAKILNMTEMGMSSAYSGQMLIGIINVAFTLIAIVFIDRFGRKKLTIMGAGLSLICHFSIGLLFFTGNTQSIMLPVFILLYTAAFAASYGPVFWTVISEIYPNKIRGTAMSVAAFANWIATAIVAQLVPWMLETLKPSGTFWAFAICSVPALYFAIKILPETKGKTLEEIEKFW
jgi:MFS transporter, SP family, arabinose:H+ symporter